MRINDDYWLVRKDGDGWRIEEHRDFNIASWVLTIGGIILMIIIAF